MGHYVFRLPDVGEGVAEAEIAAWHVAVGDEVREDQNLADVMTDKATVELSSPIAGRVLVRNGEIGSKVAVGSALLEFDVAESDGAAADRSAEPATPPAEPDAAVPPVAAITPHGRGAEDKPLAAPAVRRRAAELGIELSSLRGSGPTGRITHRDLDAAITAGAPTARAEPAAKPEAVDEIKVIGLRRKIAEKTQESKRRIPHFTYVEEIDVTEIERLRQHLNATRQSAKPKLTFLPFLIRALVKALPGFPQINATFDDDAGILRRYASLHLGLATQTPHGLVVPVIRYAERRDVWDLASEIARLAAAAREGRSPREELSGSTLTVTSLGPLSGISHTPVINHPEVAIIGPNKIIDRPVVLDSKIVIRKMMNISSSFDHRVVDGYDAAGFIQTLKQLIENPGSIFID